MPILELKNVSYVYEKGKAVLQNVSAELETGNCMPSSAHPGLARPRFCPCAVLKESAHTFGKCVVVVTRSGEVARQEDVVLEIKRGHVKDRKI